MRAEFVLGAAQASVGISPLSNGSPVKPQRTVAKLAHGIGDDIVLLDANSEEHRDKALLLAGGRTDRVAGDPLMSRVRESKASARLYPRARASQHRTLQRQTPFMDIRSRRPPTNLARRSPRSACPCLLADSVVQALLRTPRRISEVRHEPKTVTIEYESAAKEEQVMHKTVSRFLGVMITLAAVNAAAQVAGSMTLGVPATELVTLAKGWSAKNQILGKPVYNEKDEKVGQVDDIIVTPDKAVSYAILGVGGFLGLGEREIAIPFKQLKAGDGKFMLRGATKDALKGLPAFSYAK